MSAPDDAIAPLWSPSPRWRRTLDHLSGVLLTAVLGWGWYRLLFSYDALGVWAHVAAIYTVVGVLVVSAVLHEAGHATTARLAGMRLLFVRFGPWLVFLRRDGLRAWWRPVAGVAAAVAAVPSLLRDERRQWLAFCIGGPGANLLVAVLLALVAAALEARWRNGLLVAAAINATLGLTNLLPMGRVLDSDGLHLLRWWRGVPPGHPTQVALRTLAQMTGGTRADQLPADAVARLRQGTTREQAFGVHVELAALLVRGEWAQAMALSPRIETIHAALAPLEAKLLADSFAVLNQDVAFAEALLTRSPAPIDRLEPLRPTPSTWVVPRLQAVRAALAGDRAACERWLALAEREVEGGVSEGSRAEEVALRAAVRSL